MKKIIQIAIDGPAGAGKSTIAKLVAKKLEITYLDTGAMYRAITWKLLGENVDLLNINQIMSIAKNINFRVEGEKFFLGNKDVSEDIRNPIVNQNVSKVACIPEVRKVMVDLQRKIASKESIVMDGRDIGTHVLINAKYKFFLTASIEERAKRRTIELKNKGFSVNENKIREEISNRDKNDSEREVSPLKSAEDAIIIDTTFKSIDEVTEEIMSIILKGD